MNAWESIFLQSRVNDGYYDEEDLPQLCWGWPKDTWFGSFYWDGRKKQV